MNLRIAYYVVAFAISLAAFAGAHGFASLARATADARVIAAAADRVGGVAEGAVTAAADRVTAADRAYDAARVTADADRGFVAAYAAEAVRAAGGVIGGAALRDAVAVTDKLDARAANAERAAEAARAAAEAAKAAYDKAVTDKLAAEAAYKAVFVAAYGFRSAVALAAYGFASAVSLAAFAGAYILSQKAA